MDPSARVSMKDAAKCDKRREWQNSENQENAERILHFQVIPGSMSTSGRQRLNASKGFLCCFRTIASWLASVECVVVCQCFGGCFSPVPLTHEIYGFSFSNQFKLALIKSNSLFSVKHLNFDLNPQDGNRFKPFESRIDFLNCCFSYEVRQGYPLNLSI